MSDNNILWRYAGLATQFFVGIGLTLFGGYKTDQWAGLHFPLFIWLMPLAFIGILMAKIIINTKTKK